VVDTFTAVNDFLCFTIMDLDKDKTH